MKEHPVIVVGAMIVAAFGAGWLAFSQIKQVNKDEFGDLTKELREIKVKQEEQGKLIASLTSSDIAVINKEIDELKKLIAINNKKPMIQKSDCHQITIDGGSLKTVSCPPGTVMSGLTQNYHGGAWRNWIYQIECCKIINN